MQKPEQVENLLTDIANGMAAGAEATPADAAAQPNAQPAAPPAERKKKPGRPKKKTASAPVELHGIVDKPVNDDDVLELVYSNPTLFKKIFSLQKAFDVSEIEMCFDQQGVRIITRDHLGKSTIYVSIDGRCMNLYYCKEPIRVCVGRISIEKMLSIVCSEHYKITFILKENYRSTLYCILKNIEYNNDESFEIDVIYKPDEPIAVRDNDSAYPLKFKMSSKHFKMRINSIKRLSSTFTIQKCGADPLQFTYDRTQKINWTSVYRDTEKIELQSTIADDDILSVSVCIAHIQPFSNSNIGTDVFVSVDKHQKIAFGTMLDKCDLGWAASVKIFTEIKDYRPPAVAAAQ